MEVRKFMLDVAVRDGAPIIDVSNAIEKAAKAAHYDVLAVELRFNDGDGPDKELAARKRRKYTRKTRPVNPDVSPNTVKVKRRGTIQAGANARDMEGL